MFVFAGLSLLYDIWPKPVRPVLLCLHLWDLHDLQQRRWHGFNSGVPTPGSLCRRCHDDTGSRTSPGWVEGRKACCTGRMKKAGGEEAALCTVFLWFILAITQGVWLKELITPPPTLSLTLCFSLWFVCVCVCVCVCVRVHPPLWLPSLSDWDTTIWELKLKVCF